MASGIIKFIGKVAVQPAVYWSNPAPDGYGGYTFSPPMQIYIRWDEKTELITDRTGKEYASHSEILSPTELIAGGYLWNGLLSSLTLTGTPPTIHPANVPGAYEIVRVDKTPLFKSTTEFVIKAYL